jgi:hypothetical protein
MEAQIPLTRALVAAAVHALRPWTIELDHKMVGREVRHRHAKPANPKGCARSNRAPSARTVGRARWRHQIALHLSVDSKGQKLRIESITRVRFASRDRFHPGDARHLVATAIAATFGGLRANSCVSQGYFSERARAWFKTANAPTTRMRRRYRPPCLEMGPNRCLPLVESSRETMPIQAAKSRPVLKIEALEASRQWHSCRGHRCLEWFRAACCLHPCGVAREGTCRSRQSRPVRSGSARQAQIGRYVHSRAGGDCWCRRQLNLHFFCWRTGKR